MTNGRARRVLPTDALLPLLDRPQTERRVVGGNDVLDTERVEPRRKLRRRKDRAGRSLASSQRILVTERHELLLAHLAPAALRTLDHPRPQALDVRAALQTRTVRAREHFRAPFCVIRVVEPHECVRFGGGGDVSICVIGIRTRADLHRSVVVYVLDSPRILV